MKVNYRLEVEYQVFEKGRTFFETKNYVFNSNNSQQNRKEAINKYESFCHVFKLANKISNHIKLSVIEVVNKNISGFKIPFLNIYYSTKEFTSTNIGEVLFGGYLNEFNEQIEGLVEEHKTFKREKIKIFSAAVVKDFQGKSYEIISSDFSKEEDCYLLAGISEQRFTKQPNNELNLRNNCL